MQIINNQLAISMTYTSTYIRVNFYKKNQSDVEDNTQQKKVSH